MGGGDSGRPIPTSKLPTSTTPVSSMGPNPGAGAPPPVACAVASSPVSLRMSHISGSEASPAGADTGASACGTTSGAVPGSAAEARPAAAGAASAGEVAGMPPMSFFTFSMSSPDSNGFVIKSLAPTDFASSSSKASKVPARSRTGTELVSSCCLTALQSS